MVLGVLDALPESRAVILSPLAEADRASPLSGRGTIGVQANLQPHQFSGVYNGTINGALPATGNYTGFLSQPGGTVPGVPGGAGLTYTLTDGQGVFSATGVAVFRGP